MRIAVSNCKIIILDCYLPKCLYVFLMYKIVLAIILVFLSSNFLVAADCTDPSGSTVSISTDCSNLDISGDGSSVTVDTGITIDSTSIAVKTSNATNTTINNNGSFSATGNYGLRNTGGGNISNLVNNGSITAGNNYGIRSGGTITTLTNSGTISAAMIKFEHKKNRMIAKTILYIKKTYKHLGR